MPVSTQYFAYGSNMDVEQMAHRCPDAKKISVATLVGYRFAINDRGVATVIPTPGVNTEGVLWSISPNDKVALDRYEGVKSGLYDCKHVQVTTAAGPEMAMVYIATSQQPGPARSGYMENIVRVARADHGIAEAYMQVLEQYLPEAKPHAA
jgi:cation transport regulator ChaC